MLVDRDRAARFRVVVAIFVSFGILTCVAALILMRSMGRGVNHDEHQFVASGVLLARQGLLPYRDYPYFHVPNLTYLYGFIFLLTPGAYLLTARAVSAFCAVALLIVIFFLPFGLFRERGLWTRLALGASVLALLFLSPMFTYTSGRAWNHDLPILLTVAAFLLHIHGFGRKRAGLWLFLSGCAVGAATFTRLSFALALAPFVAFIFLPPGFTLKRRALLLTWFLLGFGLAALPTGYTAILAPSAFYFDNVQYVRLNTLFRETTGYQPAMTLPGKLSVLVFEWLLPRPGNLVLLLAFAVCTLPHSLRPSTWRARPEQPFLLLILASLFIGALAPTPSWSQYYYALFPFLAIGTLYGLHAFRIQWLDKKLFWGLTVGAIALCAFLARDEYRHIRDLFRPAEWFVVKVQETSADVGQLVGPGERVLTNAPIYPLEGGADIYPAFTTGPFAMRVAPLLSEQQQKEYGFVSPERMDVWLTNAPPRAVLIEIDPNEQADPAAEQELAALRDYSARHNYAQFAVNDELTLWLRPLAEWDETVRLLYYEQPQDGVASGATLPLMFFLDARRPISNNLNIIVRMVNSDGVEVARSEGWPWGRPTSAWQPGEVWYDGHELLLPEGLPPGPYRLEVSFFDPAAGVSLPLTAVNRGEQTNDWLLVDVLQAGEDVGRAREDGEARWGSMIDLLSVRLETAGESSGFGKTISARPGDELSLELIWRANEHVDLDYTVFLHLLDAAGNLVAQWDRQPLAGFAPTSMWERGDVFTDAHALNLPADLPAGDYHLLLGMYNLNTLERLSIEANGKEIGDALEIASVTIR